MNDLAIIRPSNLPALVVAAGEHVSMRFLEVVMARNRVPLAALLAKPHR
jgi:hypothetical protein